MTAARSGNDLVFTYGAETLTIERYFDPDPDHMVEEIRSPMGLSGRVPPPVPRD